MILRFIGSESEIAGQRLKRFGQSIDLPDAEAAALVSGPDAKFPALPQAEFDKIGFTSQELEKYQFVSTHEKAPVTFLSKKRAALTRLHELRNPQSAPEAQVPQEVKS